MRNKFLPPGQLYRPGPHRRVGVRAHVIDSTCIGNFWQTKCSVGFDTQIPPPGGFTMKKWNSALFVVLAVALCAFMLNVPVSAQQPTPSSPNAAQDQSNQPMSGAMDHSEKTFTG